MSMQSLSKIQEDILADAKVAADKKTEEAKTEAKRIIERAREGAEREAEKIKAKSLEDSKVVERKKLSEARRSTSVQELAQKNKLLENAFKEALEKIKAARGKESYFASLRNLIEASAARLGGGELKLSLNRDDLEHHNFLKQLKLPRTKIAIDASSLSSVGGFVLSTADEKIRIDNTVESRLNYIESYLRKEVGKILFS